MEAAPYEILARGPWRHDQVHVAYRFDLHLTLGDDDRLAIEREWRAQRRRAKMRHFPLFDGLLWRVWAYDVDAAGELELTLGPTSYKDYVGTRAPHFFQTRAREALALPLAVCAAIVTADDRIVVARRQAVDVAAGQYHVVGGFVERGRDADPFTAMARELREEVGLALDPARLLGLGLAYDCLHPHLELCFAARADRSSRELLRMRPAEVEASGLEFVPDTGEALETFLGRYHGKMSPTGEACLVLYRDLTERDRS